MSIPFYGYILLLEWQDVHWEFSIYGCRFPGTPRGWE